MQAFISDCDRRTESARKRLLETQEELTAEVAEKANAVHELAEKIGQTLAKAEELGAQGLVDESLKLMGEVCFYFVCIYLFKILIGMLYFVSIKDRRTA